MDYIMRPDPTLTLADLREQYDARSQGLIINSDSVRVDATEARTVSFKSRDDQDSYEVPITERTLTSMATWLNIPDPFLRKLDADVQQYLLTTLLGRKPGEMYVGFNDGGITEIDQPHLDRVDPRMVVDIASKVVGDDAWVIDGWRTPKEYRFDVVVAEGADHGIAGDAREGDLTHGGLRFGQSGRLAPWVETFLYRLVCTNGMEVPETTDRVNLQKMSVAEGLQALEDYANKAFDNVERQIAAFYELRNQKVGDATQMAIRLGREGGVADRPLSRIIETLPALVENTADANMFEVVNAITNRANHPDIWDRREQRRKLEVTGGKAVTEHTARCPSCKSDLGHAPVSMSRPRQNDE